MDELCCLSNNFSLFRLRNSFRFHRLEGERNCHLPQSLLGIETTVLRMI